jgi:toxin-antitoxin system PIN domain toxin
MPVSGTRLVDANVWLALVFGDHVHHRVAASWFEALREREAAFCRITQMALLRHLTNERLMGKFTLSLRAAWESYDALCADGRVVFADEPPALEDSWRQLTRSRRPRYLLWTDAYLVAFACSAHLLLSTLDRSFKQFAGLTLDLVGEHEKCP